MHEIGIMQSVLEQAFAQAKAAGAEAITRLHLRIGSQSGVVPEALEFAFLSLSPGTLAAGAEMIIEPVLAEATCPDCQTRFPARDLFALCPTCGLPASGLTGGRELFLTTIDVHGSDE